MVVTFSACLAPQVKVWFQNRRMKWKRVKGGQQGAAAREKELVNVKKGTLLPSEFSGIAALHHSTDSLANEDSHDSNESSDHAHLWYTHAPVPHADCALRPWTSFRRTPAWWVTIVIQWWLITNRELMSFTQGYMYILRTEHHLLKGFLQKKPKKIHFLTFKEWHSAITIPKYCSTCWKSYLVELLHSICVSFEQATALICTVELSAPQLVSTVKKKKITCKSWCN